MLTLLGTLGLAGCVRADADLAVEARTNTVSGTIVLVVPLTDDTPEARTAAGATVLAIENRVLPGLRTVKGVTAAPATESGAFGTTLTLDRVSIVNLALGSEQLITRVGNDFEVAGTIDAVGQDGVPVAEAEGERPPGAEESSIRVALTFPGTVEVPRGGSGVVDGTTVTWESSWDTPLVLEATASATSGGAPPWIWKALVWGIGGVVVLALAGLGTVWAVSRRD